MNAKTPECFVSEIMRLRKNAGPMYGDNVIPAIKLYKSLTDAEETRAFQDALELLLAHLDEETRRYGITLCLGFFVFKDVV